MIHVTGHAIECYRQRVRDCSEDEARVALLSGAVLAAAEFGAPFVRLGTGQRIVIADGVVVTVLPAEAHCGTLGRIRHG